MDAAGLVFDFTQLPQDSISNLPAYVSPENGSKTLSLSITQKRLIVDNLNKALDAQYWKDDFLGLKQREDSYYQTQNYLNVCKSFVNDVYNTENKVEKPDQISMLNDSINYFNSNKNPVLDLLALI